MKKIILTMLLLSTPTICVADTVTLTIKGMVCSFCAQGIEKLLMSQEGVEKVSVDLSKATVIIKTKDGVRISDDRLYRLIRDAGFELEVIEYK